MQTTLHTIGQVLADQFQLQNSIFQNALDKIDDKIALQRPSPQNNHLNWLLGHLLTCRYMLANSIGLKINDPNGQLYFSTITEGPYAKLEDIVKHWLDISPALIEYIGDLSQEALTVDIGNGATKKDIIQFFAYHEAYHLGQIGYAIKWLTGEAMKSN
ncbi:MAG: DinB family protein [Saprospiraceae bacterium]